MGRVRVRVLFLSGVGDGFYVRLEGKGGVQDDTQGGREDQQGLQPSGALQPQISDQFRTFEIILR